VVLVTCWPGSVVVVPRSRRGSVAVVEVSTAVLEVLDVELVDEDDVDVVSGEILWVSR
jgi:hypothetical protein